DSLSEAESKEGEEDRPAKNKKDKKQSAGARIRKAFKEMFSELKKVNWPTAKKTASAFGIVIVVVLFFLVIISAFDYGIMQLIKLLMDASVGS
ncbi:MAG: preprotein translocase subunit SecE, partial [Clostridia bacterium]|nr:preprotein translocase subunit SecE [Clostridia bacterium]